MNVVHFETINKNIKSKLFSKFVGVTVFSRDVMVLGSVRRASGVL